MLLAPHKIAIVKKEIAARCMSRALPIYFVNEYPKSGGTWLKNMLASALEVPPWTRGKTPFQSCVMQTHRINTIGMNNVVVLHRDGRDVMVSFYYHSFFYNDVLNASHVKLMRRIAGFDNYDDISTNLLPFMKIVFDSPASPNFSWPAFVRRWGRKKSVVSTSYEALRSNTGAELLRIVRQLEPDSELDLSAAVRIADDFTMANMRAKQQVLNEDINSNQLAEKPFIRKGSVGGWTEHFTDEALEWFEGRASNELTTLGYKLGRP